MSKISRLCLAFALLLLGLSDSNDTAIPRTSLDSVRNALSVLRHDAQNPPTIDGIVLAGYNFHWELEIGKSFRLIAVSCNLHGALFYFDPSGARTVSEKTDEFVSLTLFDLNEDGISEVLTDEISGRGTGVIIRKYKLYHLALKSSKSIWTGESLFHSVVRSKEGTIIDQRERVGFVSFTPSSAGKEPSIRYANYDLGTGKLSVEVFPATSIFQNQ